MAGLIDILIMMLIAGAAVMLMLRIAKRANKTPRSKTPLPVTDFKAGIDDNIYDLIIIGGGPAGSTAARRLARGGASVLVLEKAPMPRRKLCGGALSSQAADHLGFGLPAELIDATVYGMSIALGDESAMAEQEAPIVQLVTRSKFDHHLLDRAVDAGAELRYEKALRLADNGRQFRIETDQGRYYSEGLILAEGSAGPFCRYFRRPDTDDERGFCLEAEVPLESPDRFAHLKNHLYLDFGTGGQGYGWIFHHGSYYSVGLGGLVSRIKDIRGLMRSFLKKHGFDEEPKGLKGHVIPMGGIKRSISGRRTLLVGDAAGLIDPFSGEGLLYAIRSGALAAETFLKALAGDDCSDRVLESYSERCEAEFGPNLRWSLRFTRLMHLSPNIFMRVLTTDEKLLSRFLSIAKGTSGYRDLMPAVIWNLIKMPFKSKS